MALTTTDAATTLSTASHRWFEVFAPDNSWWPSSDSQGHIGEWLLLYLGGLCDELESEGAEALAWVGEAEAELSIHPESDDCRAIGRRYQWDLGRGLALLRAAGAWEDPSIGPASGSSETDKLRGLQWRLVLAWAGFEALGRSMQHPDKSPGKLLAALGTHSSAELARQYQEWEAPAPGQARDPDDELDDFLGLTSSVAEALRPWLAGEPAPGPEGSYWVKLARCLRNATVHGALSPTKVQQLSLTDTFDKLTQFLLLTTAFLLDEAVNEVTTHQEEEVAADEEAEEFAWPG